MRKLFWLPALMILLVCSCGVSPANTPTSNPTDTPNYSSTQPTTIIVAASNADTENKAKASYFGTGDGHDEVPIQNAIDSLSLDSEKNLILIGDFIQGNPQGISIPSNTNITIQGTLTLADNLKVDACLFTNSDPVNGNSDINITDGTLKGNEVNNSSGHQYAIKFNKVTCSKVDCRIEDFRTADELMVDSEVDFINRNYGDAYTPQIKYLSQCETASDFSPGDNISLCADDFCEGRYSLQIEAAAGQSNAFITPQTFDLRFTPLILLKFKVLLGTTDHFWVYLYNARLDIYAPLEMYKYNNLNADNWSLGLMDTSSVDWSSLNTVPSDFLRDAQFRLKIEGKEEGADVKILIDDLYAIRGLNRAIITQVFDDGFSSDYTQAAYMRQYGYNGVSAVISTAVGAKNYLSLDQLNSLYQSGWDISNHSYSHLQSNLTEGEQWIQDAAGRAYLEAMGFTRSAKYRLQVGGQSQLSETNSQKINAARRYMGTDELFYPSSSLPYGYTQHVLNYYAYDGPTSDVETKVAVAKKFHTWQIVACHEVTDTPGKYKTPPAIFQGFIDYLHTNGMLVKNFSEVYSQYPLEQEPEIDFSMQEYRLQYQDLQAARPDYICSKQNLSGSLPISFSIENQPDVPRTLTWSFNSHANITAYTMVITGKDAKGITQTITLTERDGWSGETQRDLSEVSIQMVSRTGSGISDSIQIGIGSKIGLPGKIYAASDVLEVRKNGQEYTAGSYVINTFYDTVDLSTSEKIADGDDFEIIYRSNLNRVSP